MTKKDFEKFVQEESLEYMNFIPADSLDRNELANFCFVIISNWLIEATFDSIAEKLSFFKRKKYRSLLLAAKTQEALDFAQNSGVDLLNVIKYVASIHNSIMTSYFTINKKDFKPILTATINSR